MNEEQRKEIYWKAIEVWERDPQEDVMIEEMSELTKAILKLRRHEKYVHPSQRTPLWASKTGELYIDLLDEIVDVSIMIEQMKILYNIDDKRFQNHFDKKLERTAKRLDLL